MQKRIRACLIDNQTGEQIRELIYDVTEETLGDIMNIAERYVTYENINHSHPIRILVKYV